MHKKKQNRTKFHQHKCADLLFLNSRRFRQVQKNEKWIRKRIYSCNQNWIFIRIGAAFSIQFPRQQRKESFEKKEKSKNQCIKLCGTSFMGWLHSRHVVFKLSWIISFMYLFRALKLFGNQRMMLKNFVRTQAVAQKCVKNYNCWDKFGFGKENGKIIRAWKMRKDIEGHSNNCPGTNEYLQEILNKIKWKLIMNYCQRRKSLTVKATPGDC